ncbi:peptidase M36 family, partial [Rhizoctonia solani]
MCAMYYAFLLSAFALLSPITIAHRTTRRSLNFRPPREVYFQTDQFSILDSSDPHQTARVFLNKLAYPDDGYFIRKDSYTDANTGISHIYVRQVVNGLEVADGNINLNIRNGQVLSYGNSFFDGSASLSLISEPSWHQAVYCSEATTHPNDPACGSTLRRLQKSISNYPLISNSFSKDPRAAAYFFLEVAHPDLASLGIYLGALKAERHECTDPFEEEISCSGWLVTELSNKLEPIHARQVYVQTPAVDGFTSLVVAWRLEVLLPDNHYEAYVSVNDPSKIISVTDWVVDAPTPNNDGWISSLQQNVFGQHQEVLQSQDPIAADPELSLNVLKPIPTAGTYRVWRWGINDPESGKRTLEVVPADRSASPLGWHSIPASHDPLNRHPDLDDDVLVNFTSTLGNNAFAQENWDKTTEWKANGRPDGGLGLVFDFDYGADPSESDWESVEPRQYRDLSITQVFYLANMYHDLLYLYGFDEVSGNFQQYNFDKGGAEGDAVIVDAQDSGGFNNAFFSTPPDGRSGRCRMFLWNTAKPFRDGGLDAGILIHELSHGMSTRLTGGPRNSACLDEREAGGMGEGWGDFIATTVRSTSTYKDYPIGAWAANTRPGIRHFPYSVNSTGNPSLYDFLQRIDYRREVHAIGEVWAEILWVVSNKLIEKHGFSDSLFPSSDPNFYRFVTLKDGMISRVPKHGNSLMLQLIVNGMKTQPCNPTFLQARDAIIAADDALTAGENKCTLWKAFASRGLGKDAKRLVDSPRPSINGFKVPPECN